MSARKRGRSWWQAGLGLALLGGLLRCAPAYDVLASATGGAGGDLSGSGGTGTAGTGVFGGTSAVGGRSAGGAAGGSCSGNGCAGTDYGGSESGGVESGGAGFGGYGSAGIAGSSPGGGSGGSAAIGASCVAHQSCAGTAICRSGFCEACPEPPTSCQGPCGDGFEAVAITRNGCQICECAPTSECTSNSDCQNDERCYPGAQCEDGCSEPACCRGNRCSAPGCTPAVPPHCLAAGCAGGGTCLAACESVECECDAGSWNCAGSVSGAGAPGSCAQACVPP
jgi:hypothetical protein